MLARLALIVLLLFGVSGSACSGKATEYSKEDIYAFIVQVQDTLRSESDDGECRPPSQAIIPTVVEEAVNRILFDDIVNWRPGFDSDSIIVLAQLDDRKYSVHLRIRNDRCYQFEAFELVN